MDTRIEDIIIRTGQTNNKKPLFTIVAENFPLSHHKFIEANLIWPLVSTKALFPKRSVLINIGPCSNRLLDVINNNNWEAKIIRPVEFTEDYNNVLENITKLASTPCVIYINSTTSFIDLCDDQDMGSLVKFATLVEQCREHAPVVLFHQSTSAKDVLHQTNGKIFNYCRDESDGLVFVNRNDDENNHFSYIISCIDLIQPRTLMPFSISSSHHSISIERFCHNSFEYHKLCIKTYDDNKYRHNQSGADKSIEGGDFTLPYMQAQNPEKSRIFYYPDKEDDIDEDDPDNDLGI